MARIFLAKLGDNDEIVDFIDATYDYRRNTVLEYTVKKGNYLIMASLDFIQTKVTFFNVSVYSQHMVQL